MPARMQVLTIAPRPSPHRWPTCFVKCPRTKSCLPSICTTSAVPSQLSSRRASPFRRISDGGAHGTRRARRRPPRRSASSRNTRPSPPFGQGCNLSTHRNLSTPPPATCPATAPSPAEAPSWAAVAEAAAVPAAAAGVPAAAAVAAAAVAVAAAVPAAVAAAAAVPAAAAVAAAAAIVLVVDTVSGGRWVGG